MRMASTTVPTSFEQESMTTLSDRSICINSFSVSRPFSSGISTSRMMKSGRSPASIFSTASRPETTVSTWYPSTSSRVPRYFRMLGSSSTTRILSFSTICAPTFGASKYLKIVYRQQERKSAAPLGFAVHPDLATVRLHQALGYGQAQAHSGGRPIDANEILEDFLMMLGGDAGSSIRDGHFEAVGMLRALAAALHGLQFFGRPAFPEVELRS